MAPVSKSFYRQSTVELAQALLGTYLVLESNRKRFSGRIVETEAYLFRDDPACHAHRGMTKRNAAMFGPAGRSYVYLIYGMHHCLNVVSGNEGEGEAVLIRALEPIDGIDLMQKYRRQLPVHQLCNGPGRLTQAFGITLKHNDICLRTGALQLHSSLGMRHPKLQTVVSTRIGISKGADLPLRFLAAENKFVSRRP